MKDMTNQEYFKDWLEMRMQCKKKDKQISELTEENEALKKVISMLMTNDSVEVFMLENIVQRKPAIVKLQENIGGDIIVRFERG